MILLPTLHILPWVCVQPSKTKNGNGISSSGGGAVVQERWQQQAFGPLCQASIEKFLGNSSLSLIAVRPLPVEVQGLLLQLSELLNCTMGYILSLVCFVPFLKIPAFEMPEQVNFFVHEIKTLARYIYHIITNHR